MGQVALKSKSRSKVGKGISRRLRVEGRVPAVLYGPTIEPIHLDLEEKEVATLVQSHGLNPVISLTVEGGSGEASHLCMIKDVQKDVFQKRILHVDLRRVDLTEKVGVVIPLVLQGVQTLRAKGGIIEQMVRGVRVFSLPSNIPDAISVDISHLKIGQTVHVGNVPLPEGVELGHDKDAAIVNVFATRGSALYAESAN